MVLWIPRRDKAIYGQYEFGKHRERALVAVPLTYQ